MTHPDGHRECEIYIGVLASQFRRAVHQITGRCVEKRTTMQKTQAQTMDHKEFLTRQN